MTSNKDKLISNIFYIIALTINFLLFGLYFLILCNVIKINLNIPTLLCMGLTLIALAINLTIIVFENKKKIYISSLVKILIFLCVIAYIAVYPAFNLYNNMAFIFVYQVIASLIMSIMGISIFFNNMKTEDNIVKVKPGFAVIFSYSFSVAMMITIEALKYGIYYICGSAFTPTIFLTNIIVGAILSLIYNIVFYISLKQNKTLVNYCIIEKL